MRLTRFLISASIVAASICIPVGCSGNGDPATPPSLSEHSNGSTSAESYDGYGRTLWGMWEVTIDGATGECDIVPMRGAMFNANVVRFLQPPSSPIHLITISVNPGSDLTTGHMDLDVTLRHPFVGLNKFRGFDVRGIVMGDGNVPFLFDLTVRRGGVNDLRLENPDGWTRWWNPSEFTTYDTVLGYTHGSRSTPDYYATATINPYKYFADGLERDAKLSDVDPANRGSFSVNPGVNTRRYILQFPRGPSGSIIYKFNYAVDASWALPDPSYAPEYPPEAYPPEANMQEAWQLVFDSTRSTAWYVNENAKGGTVQLDLEIFDWQGAFQPSGVEGEVGSILLDSPLFPGPIDMEPISSVLPGGPASSIWSAEIADLSLTSAGMFECWVGIEADEPSNYAPQIEGDPYMFDWPDAPLRSYWLGYIEVSPFFPSDAPEVDLVIPPEGDQSTVVPDLQVIGRNFQDGAEVTFWNDIPASLAVSNTQWISESTIMCDVDCAGPLGFYNVTVENPDTQEGTLFDGFEVVEAPGDSIWWQSHMYNVANIGRNPTVPGADPEFLEEVWSQPVSGDKKYCTPVVADGKIIFTGNDGFYGNTSMTVWCFDLYTGEQKWSHPINPSDVTIHRAFAGPVWWQGPDGIQRVAVGGDQVYCYEAESGDLLWEFDATAGATDMNWISNQLQEYQGKVLARSRYDRLYVLDFITGGMLAEVELSQAGEGGCGAKDGLIYISSNHYVDCADIITGDIVWSTHLPHEAYISHWINPTVVEDRLYVSTYTGYVFAIAIEGNTSFDPGEIIWEWYDPEKPFGTNPLVGGTAVIGNKVFAAAAFSGNYVYCIEDTGTEGITLWKSSTTGYFDASPVWSSAPSHPEGVVYCPDRDGFIRAYDVIDGSQVWVYNTGGEFRAGISPILDMLVVTSGTDVRMFREP